MEKRSLATEAAAITEHWRPRVIAELNGQEVKLAKFQGLFLGVSGHFRIEFRDHVVTLGPGDLCVVPKGVEHRPVADKEATALLFEPAGVKNTGNVDHPILTAPPRA
jgi:hypothetical protein